MICRTRVVFPAPLGPRMPRSSPSPTVNVMSRLAQVPFLYLLLRPRTSSGGASLLRAFMTWSRYSV